MVAIALSLASGAPASAGIDGGDGLQYVAVTPARLLDTRTGAPAGPGRTLEAQVTGGAVPAGTIAVNLNLVALNAQGPGYVTAFPAGTARPPTSVLNFVPGPATANAATVQVGAEGRIALWSSAPADLVLDLTGYYGAAPPGQGLFEPVVATRVLDTRVGMGAPGGRLTPSQPITLSLAGQAGVPPVGAGVAVLSLTAVSPSGPGYLTAWAAGTPRPATSDLNFQAGQVVANRVTVRLGAGEAFSLAAGGADTDVVADLEGWYTDGSNPQAVGAGFHSLAPARILDSRSAGSASGTSFSIQVGGSGGVPSQGVAAVALNLTTTLAAAPGVVTLWPHDSARPLSGLAQFAPDRDRAQAVTTRVGGDGQVSIFLSQPSQVIADLSGWFGPVQAIPVSSIPGQPQAVAASLQGGALQLSWQPPLGGGQVASYSISGPEGLTRVLPAGQLQTTFSNLKPGLPYTFTVSAVGPAGSGPASVPTRPLTLAPGPGLLSFAPQVSQLVMAMPGVFSISVKEFGGLAPQSWALGGQQDYDAASTYKLVAILAEAQAIFGGLKTDQDQVCFQDSDYEDGVFGDYQEGSCFSIAELAARAGLHSDNTAGHMLVRDLGGTDVLNAWAAGLGAVNPRFHDPNLTTSDDLAAILSALAEGRITGPAGQAWAARFLAGSDFESGIPAGLAPGVSVVHKVGFRDQVVDDAGWIRTGSGSGYVLVALTDGSGDAWGSIAAISSLFWSFEAGRQ